MRTPATNHESPQPPQTDRDALLADSELRYEQSGGIAGFVSGATIKAFAGAITVEHRPINSRHGTPPDTGTLPESDYLELWAEAERADIWSLKGKPSAAGAADMIQYELQARIGERAVTVRWTDEETTPASVAASRIGSRIVAAANRAVTPER
jgi:hypothetical protein